MDITIQKSEYDSLIQAKSKLENSEEKVKKLEDETSNKSVAIEESRKKLDEAKKTHKTELEAEKEKNTKIIEKLGIKEGEDPLTKIDELSGNSTKYSEILEKQNQDRKDRIESHKKTLGEDFLKDKASLFEGLDEDKQETFLKEFITLKGLDKDKDGNPIKVGVNTDGGDDKPGTQSNFDKLVSTGASATDLISAMD